MRKSLLIVLLIAVSLVISGCNTQEQTKVECSNNEDCALCGETCITLAQAAAASCLVASPGVTCECQSNKCLAVKGQIVGGDKDEHGCIGSAGYSWCEAKQKCLRIWEEECTGTTQKLRICPEEWWENRMPCSIRNSSSPPCKREPIFIVNGDRRNISEFDLYWIKDNCEVNQPTYTY